MVIRKKIILSRDNSIDVLILMMTVLSCFSSSLYILFYFFLICISLLSVETSLKALIASIVRGVLSKVVAVVLPFTVIKWVFILEASLYILLFFRVPENQKSKYAKVTASLIVFSIVSSIGSLLNSTYPVVSIAKLLIFTMCFIAIMKGMSVISDHSRLVRFLYTTLFLIFMISVVVIPIQSFRIVNDSFQGIVNHPNMFGILCPIFFAIVLYRYNTRVNTIQKTMIFLITLFMCYLCGSRTGMLSLCATLMAYYLFSQKTTSKKSIILVICVFLITMLLLFDSGVVSLLETFVFKGNDNLLYSRESQIGTLIEKFSYHPFFGSGFMTPYVDGIRSYNFNFDLVVEPGNMFLVVLSDTGIIGCVLFLFFLFNCFWYGEKKNIYLFVAAIMINIGETVFFSINNIAILCYILVGLYLFACDSTEEYKYRY